MPDIYAVAEQHRRELLQRERRAASEMVRAYGEAWKRIKARLDDLSEQIAQARARGEEVSPSWLFQYERMQALQRQVEAEIREFARFAEARVIAEQAEAVRAAQEHAEQLALAGLGEPPPGVTVTWARLPRDAVTDLVGFLHDGSPLRDLLDELGPEASKAVRDALVAGVATGQNPRVIAQQVRQALGGNLVRALRISRTEVLRSYREASKRSYQANSDVVKGWIWHSALGTRTCPACWAMHGTFHQLDERLDDHVNGRCSAIPVTKTWEELGFKGIPEARRQIETGADLFEKLPDADKEKILGKAAFQAYKAGTVKLEDFVGRKVSREWGTMRYTRSLRDVLGGRKLPKSQASAKMKSELAERMLNVTEMESPIVQQHLAEWSRLPDGIKQRLALAGVKVRIGNRSATGFEGMERLRGVHPRGWPGRSTWDKVPGLYDPSTKTIIAGSGVHGSGSLILHETGHAIGDTLGYNGSESLRMHHRRLYPRLMPYLRQGGAGGRAGTEELLAEGIAMTLMNRSQAVAVFDEEFVSWLEREVLR